MNTRKIEINFSNFEDKNELNIMLRLCLATQDIQKLHYYFLSEDENRNNLSHKMYLIKITIGHLYEAIHVMKEMISFHKNHVNSDINSIIRQLSDGDRKILNEFAKLNNSFLTSMNHMRNNLFFHYRDDKNYVRDAITDLEGSTFSIQYADDSDFRYISAPDIILSNVVSKKITLPNGILNIDQFLGITNNMYRNFLNLATEICFQYFEKSINKQIHNNSHSKTGDS